ncbi:UDP-galactopyranose mutase [Draconibacterium orientale]|uniref:UDP-galactopyranose mutase n=1 Tax=Draconibacterium orientale TaxID=1168034 RepID=A0A1I0FC01_9BACT|nr:UDP-galactopyranose mutase [Draconibacterium orientale]SET55669.1 UDP-galactopyranose mutase [Draconibacterium orientale]
MYDILIVGAGPYGSTVAYEAKKRGLKCLVVEKRDHIGGNIYTKNINGINVHYYGAHIFHTSNKEIWNYVNQFAEFNHYINSPLANYKNKLYNLPFNMNTFYQMWGTKTPAEALAKIEEQKRKHNYTNPSNLEEQALMLVGEDIYFKLIKGYTEKQWGLQATEIPAFIIRRIPVRLRYDNNYFNDPYQGIPIGGYTAIIEKMLEGIEIQLNTDFLSDKNRFESMAKKIVYTGEIDRYFDYKYGQLDYRSLRFEHQVLENTDNFQGNAVVNYTEREVPYTRIIEHKHFEFGEQKTTVISKEYSEEYKDGTDPYYPINDERNNKLYARYKKLADNKKNIHFGGRLGEYKYYDMDKVIASALSSCESIFNNL